MGHAFKLVLYIHILLAYIGPLYHITVIGPIERKSSLSMKNLLSKVYVSNFVENVKQRSES